MHNIDVAMCIDCLMVVANDDTSGMTEDRAAEVYAGIAENCEGGWILVPGDGEEYFSWQSCDICRTTYGGDRFDGVLMQIR